MSLWELPKRRLSEQLLPHFSPRDAPGSPRINGKGSRKPSSALRPAAAAKAFVQPVLEAPPGWLVGGLPPALPTLASSRAAGGQEQGPGQAIGPLDGPVHTTQTLMAWWSPTYPAPDTLLWS